MSSEAKQTGGLVEAIKWLLGISLAVTAIVGNTLYAEQPLLYRALAITLLMVLAAVVLLQTEQGKAFSSLVREARKEAMRVVWPGRQETFQTTAVVVVVVFLMALLLYLLDVFFGWIIAGLVG